MKKTIFFDFLSTQYNRIVIIQDIERIKYYHQMLFYSKKNISTLKQNKGGIMSSDSEKKVSIFYFSGTGNTQIIAKRIDAKFKESGFISSVSKMEETRPVFIDNDTIVGIGFPIASFVTYKVAFDFIRKLPEVDGVPIFGFCTMGGASLWGIIDEVRRILVRKGYKPVGYQEFRMPLNIFAKFPEKMRKSRIEKGFQQADGFVNALIEKKSKWNEKFIGSKLIYLMSAGIFKLADLKIHQKLLKIRVDHNRCVKCGICVEKCPINNIQMNDKIVIGDRCQYCFRCVAVCPKQATFAILTPKNHHYRAEFSDL